MELDLGAFGLLLLENHNCAGQGRWGFLGFNVIHMFLGGDYASSFGFSVTAGF